MLSVPGLRVLALELAAPESGAAAAMLGFPENGPYTTTPVRVGRTLSLVGRDAYGRFPTVRKVTAIRGRDPRGELGRPGRRRARVACSPPCSADATGAGKPGGYGVPHTRRCENGAREGARRRRSGRADAPTCVER